MHNTLLIGVRGVFVQDVRALSTKVLGLFWTAVLECIGLLVLGEVMPYLLEFGGGVLFLDVVHPGFVMADLLGRPCE